MSSIIQILENIGQNHSLKSTDSISNIIEKYNLSAEHYSELNQDNDLMCGFVPENDDDDSKEDSDQESEEEIKFN